MKRKDEETRGQWDSFNSIGDKTKLPDQCYLLNQKYFVDVLDLNMY